MSLIVFVMFAGGPVLCCALKVCMSLIVLFVMIAGGSVLCWSFSGCEWLIGCYVIGVNGVCHVVS